MLFFNGESTINRLYPLKLMVYFNNKLFAFCYKLFAFCYSLLNLREIKCIDLAASPVSKYNSVSKRSPEIP